MVLGFYLQEYGRINDALGWITSCIHPDTIKRSAFLGNMWLVKGWDFGFHNFLTSHNNFDWIKLCKNSR